MIGKPLVLPLSGDQITISTAILKVGSVVAYGWIQYSSTRPVVYRQYLLTFGQAPTDANLDDDADELREMTGPPERMAEAHSPRTGLEKALTCLESA